MAAAGGAAAAGIATALETRKVYEAEIEKFSVYFKTDRRSDFHVKYGLKELELSRCEISKTEWTLNISAENRYDWIVEVNLEILYMNTVKLLNNYLLSLTMAIRFKLKN